MDTAIGISKPSRTNSAIDIAKVALAVLVIVWHTRAFSFSFVLDKGFGVFIRLIVPFFFMTSAYFFWRTEKSPKVFLQRILLLYVVWSVIYLPFDIPKLSQMSVAEILRLYLWDGSGHALWYLCGTTVGFLITYGLLKVFRPRQVLAIAIVILVVGTVKSTYSTAIQQLFGISLPDNLGSRNGLFYGFPYMALGMAIAKSDNQGIFEHKERFYVGFFVSMLLVAAEGYLFSIHFKAVSTKLWLSVLPFAYCFFEIVLNTNIPLDKSLSLILRKMSTLMYVSHHLFLIAFRNFVGYGFPLFVLTIAATVLFSYVVIKLSERESLAFLRYLY